MWSKRLAVLVVGVALWTAHAQAQTTILADAYRLNAGPCVMRSGSGSPNGSVTGNPCDSYVDYTNEVWWTKWSGSGTTSGWQVGFNANALAQGSLGDSTYVSETTGWNISSAGAADFRYLYTDQLFAKAFIADLEQALAGGQIISKSATTIESFTCPALGGTAALTVDDLPSAPGFRVFVVNDYVSARTFTRGSGTTALSLSIGDCVGVVNAPSMSTPVAGQQQWNFTRASGSNGGAMAATTVVPAKTIVLDYGVSGNGYWETNAIDGLNAVNSPYAQAVTWATAPVSGNFTTQARFGKLDGILGSTNEYGMTAGPCFCAAATAQYIVASNQELNIYGSNFTEFNGSGTAVIELEHTTPFIATGNPVPTTYGSGTGIWMGNDSGTYKFRAGTPGGAGLFWDGTTLTVNGNGGSSSNMIQDADCAASTANWNVYTNSGDTMALGTTLVSYTLRGQPGTCYFTTTSTPAAATFATGYLSPFPTTLPVQAGNSYEASAYLGTQNATNSHVEIDWYDVTDTVISASVGNTCTTASIGGTTLSAFCRSGVIAVAPTNAVNAVFITYEMFDGTHANPYLFWVHAFFGPATPYQTQLSAWSPPGQTLITGGLIETGTIIARNIAAATITATQIAANTITASNLNVSTLSAITANLGSVTAGSISAGVSISLPGGNSGPAVLSIGSTSMYDYGGNLNIGGEAVVLPANNLYLLNLGGSGSGFVCVNNGGLLYFKATACP